MSKSTPHPKEIAESEPIDIRLTVDINETVQIL